MKTRFSVVFIQIFLFLFFTPVFAQWERSTDAREIQSHDQIQKDENLFLLNSTSIDSFIIATMSAYHIPGLSACILKEGGLVWHNAYGYADIERNMPVTDSTLFFLGSISKTITGAALMQLYERDLFNLDDNVNTYLPPDLQVVNPSYPNNPITFKMILSHVSSINDNYDVSTVRAGDCPITLYDWAKSYFVPGGARYSDKSFGSYPPASTWNYSNAATALLGYLVEAITDTAFDEYCNEHIFTQLSMNETSWFLANLDTTHIARPYEWTSSGYKPFPHWGFATYPCGQLRTSSLQLARFLNAFMQKGKLGDIKILDSSTVELMTTIHYPEIPLPPFPDSSQGLIWYWDYLVDRRAWGHDGGFDGATTKMFFYEPEKSGVIVLTNGDQFQVWEGVMEIVSALFDYAVTIPTGIARHDENIPEVFALRQNYPNPFNPSTTIEFALPKSAFVTLKVYNLLGEEVATLVAEQRTAGIHKLNWDARGLASGVYLYRLEAGDFIQSKKLISLR